MIHAQAIEVMQQEMQLTMEYFYEDELLVNITDHMVCCDATRQSRISTMVTIRDYISTILLFGTCILT